MTRTILSSLAVVWVLSASAAVAGQQYKNSFSCIPSACPTSGPAAAAARERGRPPKAARRRAKGAAPAPRGLTGTQKAIGAGMVVPAIQGIVRTPPKKKARTSKDDCMSCD